MKTSRVGWFEIPVIDMDRAKLFYEKIFGIKIHLEQFGETKMGWFPSSDDPEAKGSSGSLVQNTSFYIPSTHGTLVYFSSPGIDDELEKVEEAGGKILQKKTLINEDIGYMALFLDTEGNRIALHSNS